MTHPDSHSARDVGRPTMKLMALIQGLGLTLRHGPGGIELTDLTDDSRQVAAGSAFLARRGHDTDGHRYIGDALARGAAAILAEDEPPVRPDGTVDLPPGVAWVRIDQPTGNQALAGTLAERFFGHPSRQLALLAVTGTNGKTTTARLIQHLLHAAGVRAGFLGTIAIDTGTDPRAPLSGAAHPPVSLVGASSAQNTGGCAAPRNTTSAIPATTTPGAIDFSRQLARMVAAGCGAAAAEVSSHALHQGRTAALRFAAGVFTNLTGDHLDYHGTMEAYAAAKAILFEQLEPDAVAVVNADDAWSPRMLAGYRGPVERVRWCTLNVDHARGPGTRCVAHIESATAAGSRTTFTGPWGEVTATLPLVGRHNVMNALQAVAAVTAVVAMSPDTLRTAIESCPPVPGRLERVMPAPVNGDQGDGGAGHRLTEVSRPRIATGDAPATPTVLVDYAHTHDALENVLSALRPVTTGRLIVLFGCGGDRDRTKRPKMAQVACRLADVVWVTSDNPRTEDPRRIIDDILAGVPGGAADGGGAAATVHVEIDRAEAIRTCIAGAEPGDTVLLAGKGHEDYQIIGKVKQPFDDREHAAAALRQWWKERSASCPASR